MRLAGGLALLLLGAVLAHSGNGESEGGDTANREFDPDLDFAQVRYVEATEISPGAWRFEVSVRHEDEGWDHYADAWQVVDPRNGEILGERILAHPHDNEQPFTRSQSGITIPQSLNRVLVRAKCNVHGFGGREILVDLSREEGTDYKVQRRS
jgi:hypothetical protein